MSRDIAHRRNVLKYCDRIFMSYLPALLLTFVFILQTDITGLDNLSQIDMKASLRVLLRDLRSFGFDVGPQLRGL